MIRRLVHYFGTAALLTAAACTKDDTDAWGTFEAVEVTVSSETPGRLLSLDVAEGDLVKAGQVVGLVDTTALSLQEAELSARVTATQARTGEAVATIAALNQQLVVARRELGRVQRLRAVEAATAQQLDRAEQEVIVLTEQVSGARAAARSVAGEVNVSRATLAQVMDRKSRAVVVSPVGGTVLVRLAEPGEHVQAGTPLYTVAPLDTLILRAYIAGDQLSQVRPGDAVRIRIDAGGDSLQELSGQVRWVAASAEFTPTPIQTREERVTQVYAVRIAVPNPNGLIRIGMPGELLLDRAP